jgi:hypothetical protein
MACAKSEDYSEKRASPCRKQGLARHLKFLKAD